MHRSRAHLVIDSAKAQKNLAQRNYLRTVEKTRALTQQGIDRAKAAVASDGGRPTDTLEAQLGKPLHSTDIIKRLKTIRQNFIFELSKANPRATGIYIYDSLANPGTPDAGKRFVVGIETGYSPEWSVRHVDDKGFFKCETRGWRTALRRLIIEKLITPTQVYKAFGPASRDSEFWHGRGLAC